VSLSLSRKHRDQQQQEQQQQQQQGSKKHAAKIINNKQQQQQATRTKQRAWERPPTNVKETGQNRKRRDTRKILLPEKGDLISIMST
jgi:hypothetical protein